MPNGVVDFAAALSARNDEQGLDDLIADLKRIRELLESVEPRLKVEGLGWTRLRVWGAASAISSLLYDLEDIERPLGLSALAQEQMVDLEDVVERLRKCVPELSQIAEKLNA